MADTPRLKVVQPTEIRTSDDMSSGFVMSDVSEKPTDEQVVLSLIANKGIPSRAAAMLCVTEEYVLAACMRVPALLSKATRTRLMMSTFGTLLALDAQVQEAMAEMPADALGRTYSATLTAYTNLAGQFEDKESVEESDDADAAKDQMLQRLEGMGRREEAARALMRDDEEAV